MSVQIRKKFNTFRGQFLKRLYELNAPGDLYIILLAALIGTFTGFGAYLLNLIVNFVHDILFVYTKQLIGPQYYSDFLRILFPAVGGLAVGLLTFYLSPEVKGHGIPSVMEAIAKSGGYIRKRVSILTSINSGLTIGSGGSAGKEGPIVQIGAAIGSSIGQIFHVSQRRMKILVGCGTAAGLAAVFNAPIAGVVFTIEIILADFSLKAFTPITVASVIATAISHYMIDSSPIFHIPTYSLNSPWEFPIYLVMGLIGGILSVIFIKSLYGVEDFFEDRLKLPLYVKPAIGGLLAGLIGYWYPQVYGFDDSVIHHALLGQAGIMLLLILVFVKILATSFTLGSGNTGGLFTPSLFIGAMYGAFFGNLAAMFFPDIVAPPGAYALVGMGVIVAGTIHAPLSAFLIIFEVTGDYQIILPLMLGAVASTLVANWIEHRSIYTMKLSFLSERIEHGWNMELLQKINITALIRKDADIIRDKTGFNQILDIFMKSRYTTFPVLNDQNKVVGVITLRDLRPILREQQLASFLLAVDIMNENFFVLEPENTLAEALKKMEMDDFELLPVVESQNNMQFLGVVTKDDILKRYLKKDLILTETGS